MHVEKTQLDTAAAEKRCGTMKKMILTRSAPRERRGTKAENSRKNAEECVLEAKIYYQSSYNDSTKKIAYQTDTQVNKFNFTQKNWFSPKKRKLKLSFYEKIRFLQISLRHDVLHRKNFLYPPKKKEKQNTYINMKDAAS